MPVISREYFTLNSTTNGMMEFRGTLFNGKFTVEYRVKTWGDNAEWRRYGRFSTMDAAKDKAISEFRAHSL